MAIKPSHFALSEIYELKGDFKKALQYHRLFHKTKEDMQNTQATMKAKSLQLTAKMETAQKEAEINRLKNVELTNAFNSIEDKNKDIMDSMKYAKRIQVSLLHTEKYIARILNEKNKPS